MYIFIYIAAGGPVRRLPGAAPAAEGRGKDPRVRLRLLVLDQAEGAGAAQGTGRQDEEGAGGEVRRGKRRRFDR